MSVDNLPVKDHPFYQGLHRGHLLYLRCDVCNEALPYGAGLCPRCQESTIRWESSAGRGQVRGRVTYHRSHREDLPAQAARSFGGGRGVGKGWGSGAGSD